MKHNIILSILILTNLNIWCQKKGIVYYGHIESPGMESPNGPDLNANLIFNEKHASYVWAKDSLEVTDVNSQNEYTGSNEEKVIFLGRKTSKHGKRVYFNKKKDSMWWNLPFKGGIYVAEKKPILNWVLQKETKKIGNFTAHKATGFFRGRNYTAWYTLDIPLPYGPWKLQGLPGLILEAYDEKKEMYLYFKSIEYPTKNTTKIYKVKKLEGDKNKAWISIKDYARMLRESFERANNNNIIMSEKQGMPAPSPRKISDVYIESFD